MIADICKRAKDKGCVCTMKAHHEKYPALTIDECLWSFQVWRKIKKLKAYTQ